MIKHLLSNNMVNFLFGSFISRVGDKLQLLVMPWLIYELTQSSFQMGIMFMLETLPILLLSPIAGLVADRFSNKPLYIIITISQAFLLFLIPLIFWFAHLEIWYIYIIGLLLAILSTFSSVINQTITPKIFGKENLLSVNSYLQILDSTSLLIGSLLGGLLITLIGPYNALLMNSVSFLILAICILNLKVKFVAAKAKIKVNPLQDFLNDIGEGFKYVLNNPLICSLTSLTFFLNISNASIISLQIFFARDELHLSSNELSWVFFGGGLFQIVTLVYFTKFIKNFKIMNFMFLCLSLSTVGIFLVAVSTNWLTLLISLIIQSVPAILFNISNRTIRQTIVPTDLLGRVSGISLMLARFSLPISGFFSGLFVEKYNIRIIFIFLALISTAAIILFWFDLSRKIKSSQIELNLLNKKN